MTSADVRCATASCRVGSNASPLDAERRQAELAHAAVNWSATAPNGPVRSPWSRARSRSSRTGSSTPSTLPVACSTIRRPVALDPLAVVGVLGRDPLQVTGPLVELGAQRLQLGPSRRPARRRRCPGDRGSSPVARRSLHRERRRRAIGPADRPLRRPLAASAGASPAVRHRPRPARRLTWLPSDTLSAACPDDDARPASPSARRVDPACRVAGAAPSDRASERASGCRSLLVVLVDDLGVDHVVLSRLATGPVPAGATAAHPAPAAPSRRRRPLAACCW